jgi:hypothetical protein
MEPAKKGHNLCYMHKCQVFVHTSATAVGTRLAAAGFCKPH